MQEVESRPKYDFQSRVKMRLTELCAVLEEIHGFRPNKLCCSFIYIYTKMAEYKYKYKEFQAEIVKPSFLN